MADRRERVMLPLSAATSIWPTGANITCSTPGEPPPPTSPRASSGLVSTRRMFLGACVPVVRFCLREGSVERIMMTARNTLIVIGIVAAVIILVLLIFAQTSATSGG